MAVQQKQSTGVIAASLKETLIGAPGTMGSFPALVTPDDGNGRWDPVFTYKHHMTPEQIEAMERKLDSQIDKAYAQYVKLAQEAGKKPGPKPTAAAFLEDQLKDPSDKDRIQLPYIRIKNKADYRDKKTGEMKRKHVSAWDMGNAPLDLPELNLAGGSIVQPVVNVGVFTSGLIKTPTVTLKLQGVRVLKAVSFGGGQGGRLQGDISDEDLSLLGSDFEADDLSGFAAGKKAESGIRTTNNRGEAFSDDIPDDIPF